MPALEVASGLRGSLKQSVTIPHEFRPIAFTAMTGEECADVYPWLVSAVIPNWNGSFDTCECLKSISRQDYPGERIEVVIVDNASTEDIRPIKEALDYYQKSCGWRKAAFVELPYNVGIPAAYNGGIRETSKDSDVFLRLDNDVVLDPDYIRCGVAALSKWPGIGVLGGSQWRETGDRAGLPALIRWAQFTSVNFIPLTETEPVDCDTMPGCALLVRRHVIKDMVHVFDPNLLIMHDETDLLARIRISGWRVCYLGQCKCIHKGGQSTKKVPGFFQYISARNWIVLARRYAPFRDMCGVYLFLWLRLFRAITGRNGNAIRGYIDGLLCKPWNPKHSIALPQHPEPVRH